MRGVARKLTSALTCARRLAHEQADDRQAQCLPQAAPALTSSSRLLSTIPDIVASKREPSAGCLQERLEGRPQLVEWKDDDFAVVDVLRECLGDRALHIQEQICEHAVAIRSRPSPAAVFVTAKFMKAIFSLRLTLGHLGGCCPATGW